MTTRFAILRLNRNGTRTILRFVGENVDFTDTNQVARLRHAAGVRRHPNLAHGEIGFNTGEFVYIGDAQVKVGWVVPGLGSNPDEWELDAYPEAA